MPDIAYRREAPLPVPNGLAKAEGISLEGVIEVVKSNAIHRVICKTKKELPYFRAHEVIIDQDDAAKIIQALKSIGYENRIASYSIGPSIEIDGFYNIENSFDYSSLDGTYTFDKGRLVEITLLRCPSFLKTDDMIENTLDKF